MTSSESPLSGNPQLTSLVHASEEEKHRLSIVKTPNNPIPPAHSAHNFRFQDSPLFSLSPSDKALIGSMAQYGGVGSLGGGAGVGGGVGSRTSCQYASGAGFGSPPYGLTPPHFSATQYGAHASMYHAYASPHHHPYSASSLGMTSHIMAAIQNSSTSSQGSTSSLANAGHSNILETDSQACQADLLSPIRGRGGALPPGQIATSGDLLANNFSSNSTNSTQNSNLPLSPCALIHESNASQGQGQSER